MLFCFFKFQMPECYESAAYLNKIKAESITGLCYKHTGAMETSWLALVVTLVVMVIILVPLTFFIVRREFRRKRALKRRLEREIIIRAYEDKKVKETPPTLPLPEAVVLRPHGCQSTCGGARPKRVNEERPQRVTVVQLPMTMPMPHPWAMNPNTMVNPFSPPMYNEARGLGMAGPSSRIQSVGDVSEMGTLTRSNRRSRVEPQAIDLVEEGDDTSDEGEE